MGLLGEGGLASLSGTNSSASPVTIADFRPTGRAGAGPDGHAANVYTIRNNDTTGTLVAQIVVDGLHSITNPFPVMPGEAVPFQRGEGSSGIRLVRGWTSTTAGATSSSQALISGGVIGRRD